MTATSGESRLQLLVDASRALSEQALDLDATLEAFARMMVPRLADDVIVFLVDDRGDPRRVAEASVDARHAELLRDLRANPPDLREDNTTAAAIREGRTVFVPSVDESLLSNLSGNDTHAAALREIAPTSFVSVPLRGRAGVIGAFTLGISVSGRTYERDDVALAEELGRRAGLAVENALLFREAREGRVRMARLQATTAALATVMTPREAGAAVLEQGLSLFDAASGWVYVIEGEQLQPLATLHDTAESAPLIPIDAGYPVAWASRTGEHVFAESRDELLARFPEVLLLLDSRLQSAIILALAVEGRKLGAIALAFTMPRRFVAEDRVFADAIATQCAVAIDRALLMQRERAASKRAAFLGAASDLLASSLEPERVLGELTRLVVPRFADWCAVEMAEGETTRQLAVAHVDPAKVRFARELREKYPPDRSRHQGVYEVIRTGKPEIYPAIPRQMLEAAAVDAEHLELIRQLQMSSAIVVPLTASGHTLGALTLVWAESGNHYSHADLELFMELAHRAALAVDNARLYADVKRAVQVRDDFLAAAGHELKTPLAAMLMHVESLQRLIQRGVDSATVQQRLDKAQRTGQRLASLVEQLLDVSRITAGRLRLDVEPMQLDELAREVVERFEDQARQANAPITLHATAVGGRWDRGRLDQVISNLIANALKYGRGSAVSVEIERAGDQAIVRVRDRGIGIDQSEHRKIFERFERAVGDREFGGFGLGLWITRQIVEASRGTIDVASERGQGATFTVRLPIETDA